MKKIIFVFSLALVFSFCASTAFADIDKTVEDAVSWILGLAESNPPWGNYNNVPNYDGSEWVPGDYGEPQCVDLTAAYLDYLGVARIGGNANNYAHTAGPWLPSGLSYHDSAAPGDIVVWENNQFGHVGVVYAVDSNGFYYVDTRGDYNSWTDSSGYVHNTGATKRGPSTSATSFIHPAFKQSTFELDVNGWTDGTENGWLNNYATFDVYINGQRVADDVNDYCSTHPAGTAYEIKDIKVANGKAFDGFSNHTRSGYVSGGRTGTINANTDVRLTLHTVDATAYVNNHHWANIAVYNGHTYYYYDSPVTWYDATLISEHMGGHLISITSEAENTFVKDLIGNSACWLGATDKASEGTWKWTSGESFSFSKWYGSSYGGTEPNNDSASLEGVENYAHIRANSDTWNDNSGCVAYNFICEIDHAYTITYDATGGSGAPNNQTKAYGQGVVISKTTPSRSGYKFLGWGLSSSGSVTYQPGDVYSTEADLSLYAIWQSLTYTIMYDANGGTGKPDGESRTVAGGGAITLSTDLPTWDGYDFLGWATSKDATTAQYQPGGNYPGGAATLYAVWKIKQFTVTFNSDGAGSFDPRIIDWGEPLGDLPTPVKGGYFFKGWIDGNGRKVSVDTIVKSNLALTAHWAAPSTMTLPAMLTTIEEEAFEGVDTNCFVIPSSVTSIGPRAFANNSDLYTIIVYSMTVSPASDAFLNCPNLTIVGYKDTPIYYYALAKKIPFKEIGQTYDWILDTDLPVGARVVDNKWTYVKATTETITSTDDSMAGWTQTGFDWQTTEKGTWKYASYPSGFDTGSSLYSKYNKSALAEGETINGNTKRVVDPGSSFVTYIYWHWTFADCLEEGDTNSNVLVEDAKKYNVQTGNVYRDYVYFDAFEDTVDHGTVGPGRNGNIDVAPMRYAWRNNRWDTSHWWWIFDVRQQTYTDSQKLFTYVKEGSEILESSTEVIPGDGITNVQHWVKYSF